MSVGLAFSSNCANPNSSTRIQPTLAPVSFQAFTTAAGRCLGWPFFGTGAANTDGPATAVSVTNMSIARMTHPAG